MSYYTSLYWENNRLYCKQIIDDMERAAAIEAIHQKLFIVSFRRRLRACINAALQKVY